MHRLSQQRVALVLGAGGPVGHAYHAGVLRALSHAWGWDPRDANLVVGTSAGAQVGALLRAGMSADDTWARVTGNTLSESGSAIAQHFTRPTHHRRRGRPRWAPAAPGYVLGSLGRPWRLRPGRLAAALLPEGHVSMEPQAVGLRRIFGDVWPTRALWITAVELLSGQSVAFGRHDAPTTDVGTAVSCSGAVPSICQPVQVADRRYVDGGMASATHLDTLSETNVDVAIVSSPLSMFSPMSVLMRLEKRRLERRGVRVITFEPHGRARAAMGLNPMRLEKAPEVARATYASTRAWLQRDPLARSR